MAKLKYVDWRRKMYLPNALTNYPQGTTLPNGNNIIEVTDAEKSALLKARNGSNPVWEEIKASRKKEVVEEIELGEDE